MATPATHVAKKPKLGDGEDGGAMDHDSPDKENAAAAAAAAGGTKFAEAGPPTAPPLWRNWRSSQPWLCVSL